MGRYKIINLVRLDRIAFAAYPKPRSGFMRRVTAAAMDIVVVPVILHISHCVLIPKYFVSSCRHLY